MEDAIATIFKQLGISHVNAALLMIVGYILWHGFKDMKSGLKEAANKMGAMSTEIAVINAKLTMHEHEDQRRFTLLEERIG